MWPLSSFTTWLAISSSAPAKVPMAKAAYCFIDMTGSVKRGPSKRMASRRFRSSTLRLSLPPAKAATV